MSRYSGYPCWFLLIKAAILAAAIPVILYIQACNIMAHHYSDETDRYARAAMDIANGWPELKNFDEYHKCEAYRYLAAGRAAIDHEPFDIRWMIRNWHTDFLAQQTSCEKASIK